MAAQALPAQRAVPKPIPGLRKAAILVMSVGEELSRMLFQNLQTTEVQMLIDEISRTKDVPPEDQMQVQ